MTPGITRASWRARALGLKRALLGASRSATKPNSRIGVASSPAVRCALFLLAALLSSAASVRAQAPTLELAERISGTFLGRHLGVLVDPTGELEIEQVESPALAQRFVEGYPDAPSFGFTAATHWVRLRVHNSAHVPRAWLLELGFPLLDDVTLFLPRGDGSYEVRASGDRRPFAERDLAYRNVVFALEEPPDSLRTYYLRVQTTGSLVMPLRAWSMFEFVDYQNSGNAVNWMFYGLTLGMGLYNLFLFAFVRQKEHLLYALYVFAMAALTLTLQGHTSQYVFPNHPVIANQMMPFTTAALFACVLVFFHASLSLRTLLPRCSLGIRLAVLPATIVLAVGSLFLPNSLCIRAAIGLGFAITLGGLPVIYLAVRAGSRPARIFLIAWGCLILGGLQYFLQLYGLLPSTFLTRWGTQIGASMETVLLSVALAERINNLRADLSTLNGKLLRNVDDLKLALSLAEQATRAKSEFLATMSHELRTPLNAIINLPQGIAESFQKVATAICLGCQATFELEPGDRVDLESCCPECGRVGALELRESARYIGEESETLVHLGIVERAGKHLLQMVNGVLDFSKLEAGRVELKLQAVSVSAVFEEAFETLAAVAAKGEVQVQCLPFDAGARVRGDPLRLKQVLINVIGNAIKFSPRGSNVEVSVGREASHYLFRIRDQGIGIAAGDIDRIFRKFEQVDQGDTRKYGGTGLGLSISRSFVELHGGEIWVQSELGKGSTFFIRLPASEQLSEDAPVIAATA
jgi:two-component system, sensor histidine kinase LadS